MNDEITIDGKIYISSKNAASLTTYAQDYIGQLARAGNVDSQRVGGLWYVSKDAILVYKPEVKTKRASEDNEDQASRSVRGDESAVTLDGKEYISAGRASEISGYNQDYVSQLARGGTILARQIGSRWFVEKHNLIEHKKEKDALLAAVQASAVGIKKNAGVQIFYEGKEDNKDLSYTYQSEEGDLIPNLIEVSADERLTPENSVEIIHQIPIHVLNTKVIPRVLNSEDSFTSDEAVSNLREGIWLTLYRIPAALTVVIILSLFGYFSFSKNALYAGSATTSSANFISERVGFIGAFFSNILSHELVYKRN